MDPLPTELREIVLRALREDAPYGDITTRAVVSPGMRALGRIVARSEAVVAGLPVAEATFAALDDRIMFRATEPEGTRAQAGSILAEIEGRAAAILTAERTALNFLQRMCGIATLTARFVERVQGLPTRILDTRKTAPGLRALDKYAVRAGGGQNHRFGLSDGVLIKDNHLRIAGGIGAAVAKARAALRMMPIQVEVSSVEQVEEALAAGAEAVLLDNMTVEELRRAVARVAGAAKTEASGGVTLDNVRAIAETGVDMISVGSLTHSAPAADIALDFAEVQTGCRG
jgi:nicotinate-nucleotide pyrophosphorylase (carboxylating)